LLSETIKELFFNILTGFLLTLLEQILLLTLLTMQVIELLFN